MQVGERILCRHPFNESKRAYVVPQRVEELLKCYWPGNFSGATSFACFFFLFGTRCCQVLSQTELCLYLELFLFKQKLGRVTRILLAI